MKKYNKLFAILFAVLGVTTLKAQTDVTSTYLTNADFEGAHDVFVKPKSDRAIYGPEGWTVTRTNGNENDLSILTSSDLQSSNFNAWTINDEATRGEKTYWARLRWGGQVWKSSGTTGSPTDIQLKQIITLPSGVYRLSADLLSYAHGTEANNHTYLKATSTNNNWAVEPTINHSKSDGNWENKSLLITSSGETQYTVILQCLQNWQGTGEYISGFDNVKLEQYTATSENPVDISSLVSNTQTAWVGATELPTYVDLAMPAVWKSSHFIGDALVQTLSDLPIGKYEMTVFCHAHNAWVSEVASEGDTDRTFLEANNVSVGVPISLNPGADAEKDLYTLSDIKVTNGELTIKVTNKKEGANWLSVYVNSLRYLGPDLDLYLEALAEALDNAKAIDQGQLPSYFATKLQTAIDNGENVEHTQASIQAVTTELLAAISAANEVLAPYKRVCDFIELCKNILENSEEFNTGAKDLFSTAVTDATTDASEATTVDAINEVYNILEAARRTYVVNADPTNETYFDYTFLMTNPEVSTESHWTNGRYNTGQQYTGAPDNRYLDSWNGASQDIYQAVEELPNGYYTVKAAGRASTACTSAYIYLNDTKVEIDKAGSTDNDLGNGWKWYTTAKTLVDGVGTAKIGFACNSTEGQWAGADDFHFYYYGYDVVSAQNTVTYLKSGIEGRRSSKMSSAVREQMETAYNNADASKTTRKELEPMIAALRTAIDAVDVSIAEYEKIATYIAKANTIDESIAADVQTQYDDGSLDKAEPVFQALEVATYDYVTENFNYAVPISSTWNSTGTNTTAKEFSNEHWSGETRGYMNQNDDNGQGWNANAWSLDFDQDVTLPAGEYVFKVAGRKSANATLQLVVTMGETTLGTVSDFPNGNASLGITKTGEASFDPEDPAGFANNGAGFGWQWRYVKFTLDAEATTVKIAVHAETNAAHNWVSFGDYTLQMTEETYLEANKGGLDAPTAAAEALVDSKPMGTAEKDALTDALALPVTTGAELLAKIDALDAAVANANTWVAEYNAAKAPLVAALERFETDYNDGANGCLYHLQKAAWSTVIEKVQAAAEAKDVTNSYAGFEAATTDLVAALDAAQASINMYAKLKAEIAYAQAYTPLIEGNAAGHTAAITAALNAYDAAETADASELILAMQNYKVLDYTYVTETYSASCNLGDWTGSTGTGKSEHWSGNAETTYFDYSRWSGEAKAYEATQTITLPAGEYVLMAAGRASEVEGTEAYIKVDDNKVNFNTKGSYGLGIDTDGKANFSADGTYGRDGEGYGWEYRFIEFTLTEETEVTLVAGMNIVDSHNPLSWAGVCTPQLFTTPLSGAKNNLQKAIDDAEATLAAYPIGEEAFQISENSDAYKVLSQAIVTAKGYLGESNIGVLEEATETLNAAVETFETSYVLNAPSEGQRFYIKVATEGHGKYGNAVLATLGTTGANNPTGYGLNANNAVKGYLNQAFTFTQVEGNLYNISIERKEGTVYLTYGALNGSAAGWKNQQIQATTVAENKGQFKIVPTGKNGILKIFNTIDNNYLDCQDGGSIYTDTSISNEEFAFELAPEHEVALSISPAGWATLILPFNADIPEGVVAYTSEEVADYGNGDAVQLIEAESFVANTPYLVSGVTGSYVFSGYGLAQQDSYQDGLFTGTYVEYQTTANSNTYVLQKHNDEVAFYLVGESAQPVVKAYRMYMTYEKAAGAPMFRIGRGTTGIEDAEWTMDNGQWTIYDLMGRKVTTMEKGNMYIVNGKKVIVK